jgi:hypothetical protein
VSVPAGGAPEFPPHSLAPAAHIPPIQPTLPAPPPPLVRPAPPHAPAEWRPEYDQRHNGEFGHPLMRNGHPPPSLPHANGMPLGPPGYHSGPPLPPPHLNGYHGPAPPSHHQGPPPGHSSPYGNGIPPPHPPHQPYPTHQSPYGPVSIAPSGPLPLPATSQPYTTNSSPSASHFSPPMSISALAPPPSARMFSVERSIAPNLQSPSLSRRSVDPQLPSNTPEQKPAVISPEHVRPQSSGRANAGPSGSGASASPSLKNLLL